VNPKTAVTRPLSITHSPFCDSLFFLVKILYVSQYFPPEMGAPAGRVAELASRWAQSGHEVSVLTGFPNHPTGVVPTEWRTRLRHLAYHHTVGGVNVFRTWLWPLPNRKSHERIVNYASFCASASLRGLALERPDVIIASSPQLLVGLAGWWLAFAHQVPFVFEVRDLWPESLAAVGVGDEDSWMYRFLAAIARFLYRQSHRVVVVTPAFKEHLMKYWKVPPEKIDVVENGVETDLFIPEPAQADQALRRNLGIDSNFLACYIGTLGNAHGLETLLDAASQLQSQKSIVRFLLVGEGAEKERIKALAQSRALANVRFLDQQERERIPAYISAADACLVLLKKNDVFKTVIPSKLLEFMSSARPVILGLEGLSRQIVEQAGCGLAIEPENAHALTAAIQQLASNRDLGIAMGQKGREFVLRNYSRAHTAEKYLRVLEGLVA